MEINLVKYLSPRRVLNSVKIISSFSLSKILRRPVVWGMPLSYSIEPTNHCNLQCPECPSGLGELTRPLGLMKMPDFKELINSIYKDGFYIQLFFQGEPYINKQLPEMINYAREKKMYISISTNGHFINKNNADFVLDNAPDKLIYSIDGLDEKTYQNYRVGGTFKQADEGLRTLLKRKRERKLKRPFVELQFIVMKQNEHQIDDVFKYGKDTGVNKVVLKTMQVSSYQNALHYLPKNEKYRRYTLSNNDIKIKAKLKDHCFALWRTSVITWDGKVVPCCFDKDANYQLGSVNGKPFNQIWKGLEYTKFRESVLSSRKGIPMCTNCTEGLRINILEIEN